MGTGLTMTLGQCPIVYSRPPFPSCSLAEAPTWTLLGSQWHGRILRECCWLLIST